MQATVTSRWKRAVPGAVRAPCTWPSAAAGRSLCGSRGLPPGARPSLCSSCQPPVAMAVAGAYHAWLTAAERELTVPSSRWQGVQYLTALESLNLYYNSISSLAEVLRLHSLPELADVDFRLNPVVKNEADYRLFVVHMLPKLRQLGRCRGLAHGSAERRPARSAPWLRPCLAGWVLWGAAWSRAGSSGHRHLPGAARSAVVGEGRAGCSVTFWPSTLSLTGLDMLSRIRWRFLAGLPGLHLRRLDSSWFHVLLEGQVEEEKFVCHTVPQMIGTGE